MLEWWGGVSDVSACVSDHGWRFCGWGGGVDGFDGVGEWRVVHGGVCFVAAARVAGFGCLDDSWAVPEGSRCGDGALWALDGVCVPGCVCLACGCAECGGAGGGDGGGAAGDACCLGVCICEVDEAEGGLVIGNQ